ncbi:hypothetical protein [Paenalcaligenes suwonensis]|uniref:hypothetical protein n=1 Tax=Paenalcaligenes suwonensis TaxID=1202713 RepID=UPI00140E7A4B|nr:hypothetical protein [Paenalcaligenes suwonensis]NHC63065.1 hypothetical protein [Paenalcaligenes suwonensis]
MSNPTVLSDAEIKEAMQCLVAEVDIDGETVTIKNVNQCLRNIEQALLQSPEIQQLRKDAELWNEWLPWLRAINRKPFDLAMAIKRIDDAAMEAKQP